MSEDSRQRQITIQSLKRKIDRLKTELNVAQETLAALERIEAKERFNCGCVRFNRDIGVYDMADQFNRGRKGLQLGAVSETFSALEDCSKCHGKGVLP